MTEEQKITPEQRIIQAAIDCIERFGLQGATNRRIAEMADVNVAAINYYFRSKKNLIDQCMHITLDNAFDWEDLLPLPADTPQQWCVEILVDLTKGSINYPGLTRAHFQGLLLDGNYDSIAARRMADFMGQWAQELRNRGVTLSDDELQTAVAQLGFTFISVVMAPKFFDRPFGLTMEDEGTMRAFYSDLVKKVFAEESTV